MLGKAIFNYYWFGTCLRYLQDCPPGVSVGVDGDGRVLGNLKSFLRFLDDLGLIVTRRASDEIEALHMRFAALDPEHPLDESERNELSAAFRQVRPTLEAELKGHTAFVVTPKIIDVQKLLNEVSTLLRPGVFERLPDVARLDLSEAGRCIAFERPTAAAFHILRATEAVLRSFYRFLVRKKRIKSDLWGPLVADMRTRRKLHVHAELLNHLDHIRHAFRNPTQHPEKVYDIHEVQELWNLCIDAINRMAIALEQRAA